MNFPSFPTWAYGPNGASGTFDSAAAIPAGWVDHPSKVEGGAAPSDTGTHAAGGQILALNPGGAPLPGAEFPNPGGSPLGTDIGAGASVDLRGKVQGMSDDGTGPASHVDLAKAAGESGAGGAGEAAGVDPAMLDDHGWPWQPDLHAATKSKTNAGLWRMNVGKSRPAPKEGYPKPPVLDL